MFLDGVYMQIQKIDSLSFNGINKTIPKKLTNSLMTKSLAAVTGLSGLTALANINAAQVSLNKEKEKSYEKTLEENFFKLPAGAQPDVFQKASAAYLHKGNDVLVTAPTGTGKTAIAHYAITKNLEEGKKTFYTTPLKALSNEKFRSFQKIYGEENVGLITGDTKINREAPIVIMTTEVYRNMIFSEKFKEHNPILENLKTVIFDELHYLGDADRGGVWEQSIILSNPETQLLSLSATIGNNTEIAKWMAKSRNLGYHAPQISTEEIHEEEFDTNKRVPQNVVGLINVPSENRHVPLEFSNLTILSDRALKSRVKNSKWKKADASVYKQVNPKSEDYQKVITMLKKEDKLPAIFFIFSKKGCKNALYGLTRYGEDLNTEEEVKEIKKIIKKYESEGKYLGESLNIEALKKGYAIHNSGLIPNQKELIEELFQKKLVKVVLATETLSAGINMPARTTVISSYLKPTSDSTAINGKRELTPNEFHQMAGRAGRRGIDTIGYCYTMSMDSTQKAVFDKLINSKPNKLESVFSNPDYSFVAGYYDVCENDDLIKEIAQKSFFSYDARKNISEAKSKEFLNNFGIKRKVLRTFDFMDSAHNLKPKGILLTKLNGYEQIPIINAIYSKQLGGMTPVELASAVGGLANLKTIRETDDKYVMPDIYYDNDILDYFVSKESKYIKNFNREMTKLNSNYKPIEFDHYAINHIYDWAYLNSEKSDSEENWARIMENSDAFPIKDEGSLFKEIVITIDLLKQIVEISEEGINISNNDKDLVYYTDLKNTAQEAIKLLSKSPIV